MSTSTSTYYEKLAAMAKRFAGDTANHQMTVALDQGLYRHLKFRNPNHSWHYWFDLITVPGALIFQGDGDSFVFRRLEDMFEFFRTANDTGRPNLGYWAEKLTNAGGERSVMVYDQDLLDQQVREAIADRAADLPELAGAVQSEVLDELVGDRTVDLKIVEDFRYWGAGKTPEFEFHDVWEWGVTDYSWWFSWACHAIAWGIAQYDSRGCTDTPPSTPGRSDAPVAAPVEAPPIPVPAPMYVTATVVGDVL
jgi:hypothetical protein